jgi:hypothetical protein
VRVLRLWFTGLACAVVAQAGWTMPFVVELTALKANGWIFSAVPGAPNTPFTAPHIVLRVTGDTANAAGWGYPASTIRIDIPGVGSGTALESDFAVFADSDSLSIVSPARPTVFDMGIRAYYPAVPGYSMQTSLGPITIDSAYTYHWGPTSGMIPFTLDSGEHGTMRTAAADPGGTLQITIGGNAPNPVAARPYTDLGKFQKASGPNRIATFEEGSGAASGGVTFPEGLLQVMESVTEPTGTTVKTHAHWFATMGSPSHFALNATGSALTPSNRIEAIFPEPVLAAGLLYNCFDCSTTPFQHGFVWTTRDADGKPIEHGTIVVDEPTPAGVDPAKPGFVGLTTTKPFRQLSILRVHPVNAQQRWVIDDVRYATTLPAIEYHHAGFDHYFATTIADELTKLDEGTFTGWLRTGLQFNMAAPGAAGTTSVCRLFSTAFGPKSSHFYSSDAAECALRKVDPHWQFEGDVFGLVPTDATGACASGAVPLFRLYNNGQGGAPNHRYTTSAAARQAMIEAGWISEGAGALGTIGCVVQ